jgi:hypothetical protein
VAEYSAHKEAAVSFAFSQSVHDASSFKPGPLAFEAMQSVLRAHAAITSDDAETLETWDRLTEAAAATGQATINYAHSQKVAANTSLAAMMLAAVIFAAKTATERAAGAAVVDELWQPDRADVSVEARTLRHVLSLTVVLGEIVESNHLEEETARSVSEALLALARVMRRRDPAIALACAMSAANFGVFDPTLAEAPLRLGLELVPHDDGAPALLLHAQLAHMLARIAMADASRRRDAFEAFETTLHLARIRDQRLGPFEPMFRGWIWKEKYLFPLQLLFWSTLAPDSRPALREVFAAYLDIASVLDIDKVATLLDVSLPGPPAEFLANLMTLRDWTIASENVFLLLEPQKGTAFANVSWANARLHHPALLRAVPHSTSVLRETQLDELLLLLQHEVTHVRTLQGGLGVTLTAVRAVILQLEIDLFALIHRQAKTLDPEEVFDDRSPAELGPASVIALAYCETQATLLLKIQALERLWEPWFEGLAIFGELAADPLLDSESYSDVTSVIFNLWDRTIASRTTDDAATGEQEMKEELKRKWLGEWSAAEQLYGKALAKRGADRLRFYLGREGRAKYLPGYLAVRSIVAQWRRTTGRAIAGTEAFATLLHMTRYSGFDWVPDFMLPLDAFVEQAREKLRKWLAMATRVSSADLNTISQSFRDGRDSGVGYRWREGGLERLEKGPAVQEEFDALLDRQLRNAYDSVKAASAIEQPPGASAACTVVMTEVRRALLKANDSVALAREALEEALSAGTILGLGRASCPFWLNPDERLIACLVRTSESTEPHGLPGYDMVAFSLEADAFDELSDRVRRTGEARMTVTRVTDLLEEGSDRGLGRTYIVFELGSWMHIQPRGFLFGTTQVPGALLDQVRERLQPSPVLGFFEALLGPDQPTVTRTIAWIDSHDWRALPDLKIDVSSWASFVRDRASAVKAGGVVSERDVARVYLDFMCGRKFSPALANDGFAALQNLDGSQMSQFVRFLYDSGRVPVQHDSSELAEAVEETLGPLMSATGGTWDVAVPASTMIQEA